MSRMLQKEMDILLQRDLKALGIGMASVTVVRITPDLSIARFYISAFPDAEMPKIVALLTENHWEVKRLLAERVRNELRKMPELLFFVDDSIEYAKKVDALFEKLKKSEDELKVNREEASKEEADQ